jgi:hypothetical protein
VVSVVPWPCFSPREGTPGTHCTGGWVGPRSGLDTEARGKILSPVLGIEPWSPSHPTHSQTLYWLSYLAHSLLTTFSKVLEKVMYSRLNQHVHCNSISVPEQFGFRKDISTDDAAYKLTDNVLELKSINQTSACRRNILWSSKSFWL